MGNYFQKIQFHDVNLSAGCCLKINLAVRVNANVDDVVSSNGSAIVLSDRAKRIINNRLNAKPDVFRVRLYEPVKCTASECMYCYFCCPCYFLDKCCGVDCKMACPVDPAITDTNIIKLIWFGSGSTESCCDGVCGCCLNACLCNVPKACSLFCIDTVKIYPNDVLPTPGTYMINEKIGRITDEAYGLIKATKELYDALPIPSVIQMV